MIKTKPITDDPLSPAHRCKDFDEDCKTIPETGPHRVFRTHVACWLHAPERGWCPFLKESPGKP